MNPILNEVLKARNDNYCHAIEVEGCWALESFLDCIYNEFSETYPLEQIIDFCMTAELYCLDEDYETYVYAFDIEKYLRSL